MKDTEIVCLFGGKEISKANSITYTIAKDTESDKRSYAGIIELKKLDKDKLYSFGIKPKDKLPPIDIEIHYKEYKTVRKIYAAELLTESNIEDLQDNCSYAYVAVRILKEQKRIYFLSDTDDLKPE